MINIKRASNTCALPPLPQRADHIEANPFNDILVAWVGGSKFFIHTGQRATPVRDKRPRTQYINASQYELATQGY